MMNAIGGTSIHYWAQSWRLKPWDFRSRSEIIRRYGAAALPAGSTLEDWPLAYDDLEPFYDTIEWEVGVSGKAGNIQGKLDPRGNIFEGPRRREYPMPPLRGTEFIDHMSEAARRLGWHPFHPPAAINTQPRDHRPGCAYHGYCNAGGCHVSAKSSTAVTTIPAAVATKNLKIFDLAHVTRIVADSNGRVTGVSYVRNREEYFPARQGSLAGRLHLRKLTPAAAFEIGSLSQRARQQSRPGGPPFLRALPDQRDGAVSFRREHLVWPAGAGDRGGRFRRRRV